MQENPAPAGAINLARWQVVTGTFAALLLAILFFASGFWKLAAPFTWSQLMGQFQVPSGLALPFAILVGVGETFGAAMIIVPRFRRWGSILIGFLLIAFMAYIGVKYNILVGKDCSCFPLVKRSIGPGFFIGDSVMLLLAILAGVWAQRSHSVRGALLILSAIAVFAGLSYGINANANSGLQAPATITVDGKPMSLQNGDIFLFFYDPECMHCDAAARRMAKYTWKDTKVIAIPTRQPQFAGAFLHDTGLKAGTSLEVQPLRQTFKFVDPPYGSALHNGRQKAVVANFDDSEPAKTLRQIGFVE
jgi:uncharacterized membrane protein YphA (DoxX/SURF4 family)